MIGSIPVTYRLCQVLQYRARLRQPWRCCWPTKQMCLIDCTSMTPKSSHEIVADGKFSCLLPPDAKPTAVRVICVKKIVPGSALAPGGTNYQHKRKNPGAGRGFEVCMLSPLARHASGQANMATGQPCVIPGPIGRSRPIRLENPSAWVVRLSSAAPSRRN